MTISQARGFAGVRLRDGELPDRRGVLVFEKIWQGEGHTPQYIQLDAAGALSASATRCQAGEFRCR